MAHNEERLPEGRSTVRPPNFNGKYYREWKSKMETFIKADNYQVWKVIRDGDYALTKKNAKGETVPKPESEYEKEDFEKIELNASALKFLHCGLGPREYDRTAGCKNAKEIWDFLQITHEGTSEVKKSKIDYLMQQYEMFKMESKEKVQEMIVRFGNIVNELTSLGKTIPTEEQIRKILRSLPQDERWNAKVTTLFETKDFANFSIEQLSGSLMTHEMHIKTPEEDAPKGRSLALKADEDEDCSETEAEEAAMLVRQLRRMMYKGKDKVKPGKKSSKIVCHKCGSPEHFIKECPMWEIEKGKDKGKERYKDQKKPYASKSDTRRAMIAALQDEDSTDEEDEPTEEETAHICLMAEVVEQEQTEEEIDHICLAAKTVERRKDSVLEVSPALIQEQINKLGISRLQELLIETLDEYREICDHVSKLENALKTSKEHGNWLRTNRIDIENRFFNLLDENTKLKEAWEKVKDENIFLNVELEGYKLCIPEGSILQLAPTPYERNEFLTMREDFNKLKVNYERLRENLDKPPQKNNQSKVLNWFDKNQSRNRSGVGFNHKKKNRSKNYVDLPSSKVCTYCGETGHVRYSCCRKNNVLDRNIRMLKQMWVVKSDVSKEPKEDWVPVSDV